jgi:hypothetical protein
MDCPDGQAPYKATQIVNVGGELQLTDEVRCHPATAEISSLVVIGALLVQGEDGTFTVPVAPPSYCCGNQRPLDG